MAERIDRIIDDMLKGRKIVLERSGLDISKIDSITSEDELFSYIKNNRNNVEKNEKYLFSVAKKRFLPDTSNGGMAFKAFYDTSPMTTGDSAEVALQLMEIGRGHNVRREVSTSFKEGDFCDIFGERENITISQRKSDIVVTHEDGYTTHVESKVGLTIGKKKQNDLKQEVLADVYRVQHDPKTRQVTVICRNANNGLSELDDCEYMKLQYIAKKVLGDKWEVNYEGRKLTEQELKAFVDRPKNIAVKDCLKSSPLQINGEVCSSQKSCVTPQVDGQVRSVNGCDSLKGKEYIQGLNPNSRTKFYQLKSAVDPASATMSRFLTDIKRGAVQGAKYGAIHSGVQALYDIMEGGKPKEEIVIDVLEKTAKSAIKSGLIAGINGIADNLASKASSKLSAKVLSLSAKAFVDFCNGGMTAEGMLETTIKNVASKGLSYAKSRILSSTVSGIASTGAATAGASVTGTISAGFSAVRALKFVGGAFLACAIVACLFDGGDSIPVYWDPRATAFVDIDELGRCKITASTKKNLVDKLINYNKKVDEINKKSLQLNREAKSFNQEAQRRIREELQLLHEETNILQKELLMSAERKSIEGSKKYAEELKSAVEDYVKRGMFAISMQNAKIDKLKTIEQQMLDEKLCCEHITDTCHQIINLGKREGYCEDIRNLINTLTEVTKGAVTYRNNQFVTGTDILYGCLGYV